MNKFTNVSGISLSLAVWLADDDYDHDSDPNVISVTSLLKPLKQIILAQQSKDLLKVADVSALIASRSGSAFHTAIEESWKKTDKVKALLLQFGYPQTVVDRILINPKDEDINEDSVCIYMERRSKKQVGKFIISGKFDFLMEGVLEDYKSTKTYGYISGDNVQKYVEQGSMYRWLNQDIITEDYMKIQYIFTDWSAMQARSSKDYPQKQLLEEKYNLMSVTETESFVSNIVARITSMENATQDELPQCSDKELWRKADIWKYYKDSSKQARSTKNFDNSAEAHTRLAKDGSVGIVKHFPGEVVRCKYCDVIGICKQAEGYINSGLLKL